MPHDPDAAHRAPRKADDVHQVLAILNTFEAMLQGASHDAWDWVLRALPARCHKAEGVRPATWGEAAPILEVVARHYGANKGTKVQADVYGDRLVVFAAWNLGSCAGYLNLTTGHGSIEVAPSADAPGPTRDVVIPLVNRAPIRITGSVVAEA